MPTGRQQERARRKGRGFAISVSAIETHASRPAALSQAARPAGALGAGGREWPRTPELMEGSMRRTQKAPLKFDWEGFFLAGGIGLGSLLMSALFFWLSLSGVPKGPSRTMALSTTQRLARLLPADVQGTILIVMASLFGLFGIVCAGLAVTTVLRRLLGRSRA